MRFDATKIFPCLVPSPCDQPIAPGGGDDGGGSDTCSDPAYRAAHLNECPDDPNCSDPAFAAAHPTLCLNTPTLIIKPEAAQREVGKSVLFKTFLLWNGSEEELTSGITYRSNNTSVAVIGSSSGNATGLSVGVTTISVTYGDLIAQAQLDIVPVGGCAVQPNSFVFVVDISKSAKSAFSALTSNRLALAKNVANGFIDTTNLTKDQIAVVSFDTATVLSEFSTDATALHTTINALSATNNRTALANGLQRAKDVLDGRQGNRHIILLTDGENNEGNDPLALANELKDAGVFVWIVGLRASYTAFRLLDQMATGGFFINALPSNEASVVDWVSGLKSYICSGNCDPTVATTVGAPALNFTDFINWEVFSGHVDLIGMNPGGPGFYDLLPGNGLYVDLCGSAEENNLGTLRTRDEFNFEDQKEYELRVRIAGNNRENRTGDKFSVIVGRLGATLVSEQFEMAWDSGFVEGVYGFIASTADGTDGLSRILIGQSAVGGEPVYGCLLDCVTLRNITDGTVMFTDCFDADNPQDVEPCDRGVNYGTDYGCDTGCLDAPIPAQVPDPNPLPDSEKPIDPPHLYTSEQSCTVNCATGTGSATGTGAAISDVSQVDADAKARAKACQEAQAALVCTTPPDPGLLVNYAFSPNLVSGMSGGAVLGELGDKWNTSFLNPIVDAHDLACGVSIGFGFPALGGGFSVGLAPTFSTDLMRHHAFDADDLYFLISGLPAGTYDLYLYGHGAADKQNATFVVETGDFDNNAQAIDAVTAVDTKSTTDAAGWSLSGFTADKEYVKFGAIAVGADGQIRITTVKESDDYWYFNGWQLRRTA